MEMKKYVYSLLAVLLIVFGIVGCQKRIQKVENTVILIQVDKSDRTMNLCNVYGDTLYSYKIRLGRQPVGQKHFKGDGKTPEGTYHINLKNSKSIAHKSLRISYPNEEDKAYAASKKKHAGGYICIHGTLNKWSKKEAKRIHNTRDWTGGCIAVTNREMDEIYRLIKVGTVIEIKP